MIFQIGREKDSLIAVKLVYSWCLLFISLMNFSSLALLTILRYKIFPPLTLGGVDFNDRGISWIFIIIICRCYVSECESPNSTYYNHWFQDAIPFDPVKGIAKCERYQYVNITDTCTSYSFDRSRVKSCSQWIYKYPNEKNIMEEVRCDWTVMSQVSYDHL